MKHSLIIHLFIILLVRSTSERVPWETKNILKNCRSTEQFYSEFVDFSFQSADNKDQDLLQLLESKYAVANKNLYLLQNDQNQIYMGIYADMLDITEAKPDRRNDIGFTKLSNQSHIVDTMKNNIMNQMVFSPSKRSQLDIPKIEYSASIANEADSSANNDSEDINPHGNKRRPTVYGVDIESVRKSFSLELNSFEESQLLQLKNKDTEVEDLSRSFYTLYGYPYSAVLDSIFKNIFDLYFYKYSIKKTDNMNEIYEKLKKKYFFQVLLPKIKGCVATKDKDNKIASLGILIQSVISLDYFLSVKGVFQWYFGILFYDVLQVLIFLSSEGFYLSSLELSDIGVIVTKPSSISEAKRYQGTIKNINKLRVSLDSGSLIIKQIQNLIKLINIFFEKIQIIHDQNFTSEKMEIVNCMKDGNELDLTEKCPMILWNLLNQQNMLKQWFLKYIRWKTNPVKFVKLLQINSEIQNSRLFQTMQKKFKMLTVLLIKSKEGLNNLDNGYGFGYFSDLNNEANILIRRQQRSIRLDEMEDLLVQDNSNINIDDIPEMSDINLSHNDGGSPRRKMIKMESDLSEIVDEVNLSDIKEVNDPHLISEKSSRDIESDLKQLSPSYKTGLKSTVNQFNKEIVSQWQNKKLIASIRLLKPCLFKKQDKETQISKDVVYAKIHTFLNNVKEESEQEKSQLEEPVSPDFELPLSSIKPDQSGDVKKRDFKETSSKLRTLIWKKIQEIREEGKNLPLLKEDIASNEQFRMQMKKLVEKQRSQSKRFKSSEILII